MPNNSNTVDPHQPPTATTTFEAREIAGFNRVAGSMDMDAHHSPQSINGSIPDLQNHNNHHHHDNINNNHNHNTNDAPLFNLPMYSAELGSLPLHESFDPFQGRPSSTTATTDAESTTDDWIVDAMMGMGYVQQQSDDGYSSWSSSAPVPGGVQLDPTTAAAAGAAAVVVGDHVVQTQPYSQQQEGGHVNGNGNGNGNVNVVNGHHGHGGDYGQLQESHYTRHIIAESLYSALHMSAPGQVEIIDNPPVSEDVQGYDNVNLQDWDKYMANVDQMLYAMNNAVPVPVQHDVWQ
ncbi:hypothetical protein K435DRAFT_133623 [Dendrothele bispora CBS 962.96]|uniref:Uncharacterized protein n=1 Tax=Dendrothele bispora (strain CBS 962.96) TaxID=1314807 RepID=A0A4S8KMD4_DENBC|nr:hypothetical protein K435DRAFT_133623 [Dendrothele bispora CBS 962.96]